jgi:hypothetical protein
MKGPEPGHPSFGETSIINIKSYTKIDLDPADRNNFEKRHKKTYQ